MAVLANAPISVEEYLRTNYKPACDYIDGVLRQKPMPTRKHSQVQYKAALAINSRFPGFEADPELTVRLSPYRWFVPDVAVQDVTRIQDPYPTEPVHLCVEVLSPEDRFAGMIAKCEEYLAWGVPTAWIVDPDSRRAWQLERGQPPREVEPGGNLTAGPVSVPVASLWDNPPTA